MTDEFYQVFKEEIIPILQTLPDNWRGGSTPNSFYEARITLIPKQDKGIIRKENKAKTPHKHGYKNSAPKFSKLNFATYKKNIYIHIYIKDKIPWSSEISPTKAKLV